MACVICDDLGYEGQYFEEFQGVVCIDCLEKADEKLNYDLSDNVGHDII